MTDEDRKALDRHLKYVGLPTRRDATSPDLYADHDSRSVHNGWLAARSHYRKDVADLVEAIKKHKLQDDHCSYCGEYHEDDHLYDCPYVLAAKLKDQP